MSILHVQREQSYNTQLKLALALIARNKTLCYCLLHKPSHYI